MESISLLFTWFVLLPGSLYWVFRLWRDTNLSGGSLSVAQVQDKFKNFEFHFSRPKDVANKAPELVNDYYSLVTDMYEWGWGQSFHFSPNVPGISMEEAQRAYELMAGRLVRAKPGQRILDVGCGIGGPMRTIASFTGANVVGITICDYQVKRAKYLNKKARLENQCQVVCGNFLEMPFPSDSFDGAYAIEATGHAPVLEDAYAEVYRVMKPGSYFFSFEWVTTDKFRPEDTTHVELIHKIEAGDSLPGLRGYADIAVAARKVGFEVIEERDLALPPAGPWWPRLKVNVVTAWRNRIIVTILAALRIVPKGTPDVHQLLVMAGEGLIGAAETGIFTPMYMVLCRKPA